MSKKAFVVFIDEIRQNFVFGQPFVGSYRSTVTMSDGNQRTITLTPMFHEGREVMQFDDSGNISYMGLNSTNTKGRLMVQVREVPEDIQQSMEDKGIL